MTLLLPYGPYAGVNGPLIRTVAGKLADVDSAQLYDLAVVLGVSESEALPVWRQLMADGFIEDEQGHRPTPRMGELARARFGKPLPRSKADTLLKKVIANAVALNALPADAPYFWITSLAVFGSYLHVDRLELGDLDLAWQLVARPGVENHTHWCHMNNLDPYQSTRGQIHPKGPYTRLMDMREMVELECPYQVVYEFSCEALVAYRQKLAEERAARIKWNEEFEARMSTRLEEPTPSRKRARR